MTNNTHRPGYKDTSLGWIPEDWEVKKIGSFSKVTSGGTPSREKEAYWNGNIPWVTTSLINFNEITDAEQFITEEGLSNSSAKLFPSGTILLALYGQGITRGKSAILKKEAATNQACAALILDKNKAHNLFVFQYLISKYKDIRNLSNTGNQENLNAEIVKSVNLPLPPLPEQKAIADILSTWDEAISKTQDLIKKLEHRNKGLMQALLTGKKRLKGFESEWKENHLGEVFTERNENKKEGLVLLSIGQNGVYPQSQSDKKDTSNEDKSKYKMICKGDIGYNTMRMWQGRSALSSLDGIVSPAYTIVTPKENADSLFFSYLFKTPKLMNLFWRNSQGLVDDTLNCKFKDFSIIKVLLPEKKEQEAIAEILQFTDNEIILFKSKLEKLKEQKKGLMQKLLTGEVRVKTANKEV